MLGIKQENIFIEDLREEFVSRLRVPDVPRQRGLRRHLPARDVDRASADRQEADRDRARDRRGRRLPRRDRQGQRPGPLRTHLLRARARHQDHRTVARVGVQGPRGSDRVRAHEPDPGRQGQGRREPVLGRRQPAALLVGRQSAGRPGQEGARDRLPAHHLADGRARQGDDDQDRLREGRRGVARRQDALARDAAQGAQRPRARQRHRPPRSRREPLRRHEVARRVRDARRDNTACRRIAPSKA